MLKILPLELEHQAATTQATYYVGKKIDGRVYSAFVDHTNSHFS